MHRRASSTGRLHFVYRAGQALYDICGRKEHYPSHRKCAYDEIRSLGLSNSVPEKIAKLLLHWSEHPLNLPKKKPNEIAIRVTLTQEEIAQFAGTSRETVSRVLSEFKRKGWLNIRGATWCITNKPALEKLVTT